MAVVKIILLNIPLKTKTDWFSVLDSKFVNMDFGSQSF